VKKLGLDLGSASIAWGLRENNTLEKRGVVIFDAGMSKGATGGYTSPTKDRREARSKRNLIQARKYRKWELLEILINNFVPLDNTELEVWSKYKKEQTRKFPENDFFLKWLACDFRYEEGENYTNPYELRVKALDYKLSNHEFGRVLYHITQRRGFKNIGEKDKETEKQIEKRKEEGFETALNNNRTIAEALKNEFLDKGLRARNQYPYREEYEDELLLICKKQGYDISKNEKNEFKDSLIQKIWKAIIWQRDLKSQKGNIGKCTLEPTKPRCPISHPIFEIFRAWSFINNIKFSKNENDMEFLDSNIRIRLYENIFLKNDKNFKFEEIRKFLDKELKSTNKYNYPYNVKEKVYDSSVSGMPICNGLLKVLGKDINSELSRIENFNIGTAPKIYNNYSIYDLWHILFEFDENYLKDFANDKLEIKNLINKKGHEDNPFVRLKDRVLGGYADLSLKAMCKIVPFLKEGFLYNEAVVLAKAPELLGENWKLDKEKIYEIIRLSSSIYSSNKIIIGITKKLIDIYKGEDLKYGDHDFSYKLGNKHDDEILNACRGHFGEKTWEKKKNKEKIFEDVKNCYQEFLNDSKRKYRDLPLFTTIFNNKLKVNNIEINGKLYHHSNIENKFLKKSIDKKTGLVKLPTDKNSGLEILPEPRIDSIKNPMFNKSMSILRKVINQLIVTEIVDGDTEIVVELARELNDNNKRAAIERYQNQRENNREKFRMFLNQYKNETNSDINVEEKISIFELWHEQTFENTINDKNEKTTNNSNINVLKEKDSVKRYELWMEQKGQCMYTGQMISISQLFSNQIDIAHTIPRSLLPDNTMANMTVCFARFNRDIQETKTPFYCKNYSEDIEGVGTAILPRLDYWIKLKESFEERFEKNSKPKNGEDFESKNSRIQEKHYFKMHLDYWNDKINRFTATEIKDSWARRQLTDTQMISKYAKEFLKTYFKKVTVQKGSVTADFRKIYGFQEHDEIKERNLHTHHAVDASVLTLIPTNSRHRDRLLKSMYAKMEIEKKQLTVLPYDGFNSQVLIKEIENTTLIVNYEKDEIQKKTIKKVRKRGKVQYVKNKSGEFILDRDGNKIEKIATGDTARTILFAQTFLGKIKDVERFDDGQPIRENGDWKYKKGEEEYVFVKRIPVEDAKTELNNGKRPLGYIIDPVIRKLVSEARSNNTILKDPQGNIIRHVRTISKSGKEVKIRVNYTSTHDYKNSYYSESGLIPYAILLQKNIDGKISREMLPIPSFEVIKVKKESIKFDLQKYLEKSHPDKLDFLDKKLLKVGQKVIILKDDSEYEKIKNIDFQKNKLYKIEQFSDGSIWLKYHLEAQSKEQIDNSIKIKKDTLLTTIEKKYGILEVLEDTSIVDKKQRKDDFEKRKYAFDQLSRFRFQRLIEIIGLEEVKKIKNQLDIYKTQSSQIIEDQGKSASPLLKMSSENWNFLYEGYDFEVSILGDLIFKKRHL